MEVGVIGAQEEEQYQTNMPQRHIQRKQVHPVAGERTPQLIVTLSPHKIVLFLFLIIGLLIFMHMTTQGIKYFSGHDSLFGFTHEFNLNNENNIPTWYSSSALLLCAALLGLIGLQSKQVGECYAIHWLVLSFVFLCLSVDEAASLHEMVGTRVTEAFRPKGHFYLGGFLYYGWVIPGMLFVLIVGLSFGRFLLHLSMPIRRLFLLAGFVYVGGALGVEMLESYAFYMSRDITAFHSLILITIEEGMEMLGILIFLYALCSYMANYTGPVTIVFEPVRRTEL